MESSSDYDTCASYIRQIIDRISNICLSLLRSSTDRRHRFYTDLVAELKTIDLLLPELNLHTLRALMSKLEQVCSVSKPDIRPQRHVTGLRKHWDW